MIASYGADGLWSRQSCSITSRPFRGILRIKFACDGLSVSPTAFSTPQWSDNLRSSAPHPHPMSRTRFAVPRRMPECGGRACVVGHPTNARGDSAGRPCCPWRLPRRECPLFGAGCSDRPRRIRMPRERYAAETEAALRRTSLKLRPIKLVALLLNWTTTERRPLPHDTGES